MPVEKVKGQNANGLTMEKLVALCKNRGFVFPSSDIYGGLANSWDYGPLGVLLKNNVKAAWWKRFVQENEHNVGLDAAILMNSRVWEASGHVGNFNDPLIDCKQCRSRYRADNLIEDFIKEHMDEQPELADIQFEGADNGALAALIAEYKIVCPNCKKLDYTDVRRFNMMFKTHQGVTEESATEIYLRPETAQGIFVNFENVQRAMRLKLPFGICQIGKSFRNEITPGNFTFRTREFEQMELEFFCKPGTSLEWFKYWKEYCMQWLLDLNFKAEELRYRDHSPEELSFYSNATSDIEFLFPFGWGEIWGVADRTDYDLSQHIEFSKQDLRYFDAETNEKYIPYVVEPSLGADRLTLAVLCSAYEDETLENGESRTVMHFHPALAPIKVAVLPLSNKLSEPAMAVYRELSKHFMCEFDSRQSIGKRYRRQDEIGTPYCVTYDFDSENDAAVTIRERDSMAQVRVPLSELTAWLKEHLD